MLISFGWWGVRCQVWSTTISCWVCYAWSEMKSIFIGANMFQSNKQISTETFTVHLHLSCGNFVCRKTEKKACILIWWTSYPP